MGGAARVILIEIFALTVAALNYIKYIGKCIN